MNMETKEYKCDESVTILGAKFHGVQEIIKCAQRHQTVNGVYVAEEMRNVFTSYLKERNNE
jgi:hypothetical protein